MQYESLQILAKTKRWSDLEQEWLTVIEQADAEPAGLLPVIDLVVEGDNGDLAETMAWAWLSMMKETHTPAEALRLGRGLLLRLPDGGELRDEILTLYRETHRDRPDLETWIERSGLKSSKSVRRALGYLTTALRLAEGTYLVHSTEDVAARVTMFDADADLVTIQTSRRSHSFEIAKLVEDYEIADENDFRVLRQLRPEHLAELVVNDPPTLVIGILKCHGNRIDRDELKLMLVPQHLPAGKWSDWWGKIRNGVKRSPNLRLEGRSPMFLIYDEEGQSLEQETWTAFSDATTPREWLDMFDGYMRDVKQQKAKPDPAFLDRVTKRLLDHAERFTKHQEPGSAFATALIIERITGKDSPATADTGKSAAEMLTEADDPVAVVASVSDARLWSLATRCIERAFPDKWPVFLAELILYAPAGQCDVLARKIEKAGRGDLMRSVVERATADPGQFTDAMMWVWKGPGIKTELPIPPILEMLNIILGLVGPARTSTGRAIGQTTIEMRAKVRAGFASKNQAKFRTCLTGLDLPMAQTVRRQLERAEGLGPRMQDAMLNILRKQFPNLYVKATVAMWDDESVLYYSEDGLRMKEAELQELVNVKMRENAKAIGEAAAHGDLSENAEYKSALEERDLLRARLAGLNSELSLARVLEPDDVPTDHVSIGHRVTLRPTVGEDRVVMTVSGIGDSDISRRIYSYKTPIAGLVLGKRPGDKVTMSFEGQEADFVVESIASTIG